MASIFERTMRGPRRSGGSGSTKPYDKPSDTWQHDRHDGGSRELFPKRGGDRLADRLEGSSAGSGVSPKLSIENLHYDVSERELESLFAQIGPLALPPKINFDASGRSKGTATVTYEKAADARRAKEEYDGAPAKGLELKISYDPSGIRAFGATGQSLASRLGLSDKRKHSSDYREPRGERRGESYSDRSRGRGTGRGRGRSDRPTGGRERKPVSEADLDAQLATYMVRRRVTRTLNPQAPGKADEAAMTE